MKKNIYAAPVLLSLDPGGIEDEDVRPSMGGQGEHQDPIGEGDGGDDFEP